LVTGNLLTATISLEGLLNPRSRWRQLRNGAVSLESIIWQYRTRVGRFQLDDTHREPNRPETELCAALNDWREQLMAGASLKATNLQRVWPASIYRHMQYQTTGSRHCEDDHHSPVKPPDYIRMRVQVTMRFYQRRIPRYTQRRFFFKTCVLALGVTSSILARMGSLLTLVALLVAFSSAVTSWIEFSDGESKIDRYSAAASSLRKLSTVWDSMHEVQKQSKEVISLLVQRTELIIAEEQASWTSAIANNATMSAQAREAFERKQQD